MKHAAASLLCLLGALAAGVPGLGQEPGQGPAGCVRADLEAPAGGQAARRGPDGLPRVPRLLPAPRLPRRLLSDPVPAAVLAAVPAVLPLCAGRRRSPGRLRPRRTAADVVVDPHPPGAGRGPLVST